jgi:nanoRNase/pAp phosphatase (c-di-AMP/oligoRNAs hydrolase)
MTDKKFRLVTRSDFDGLVCAMILKELGLINDIKFVHPKDMQDGKIEISDQDITTNLPYVEGVHLAFDHHLSETIRVGKKDNHIIIPSAPSAARVVYEYYGGAEKLPRISEEMMEAVDRGDSANFTMEEVLAPERWDLMNFIMDSRTGLGRFREFRISNYQLMMKLIDYCVDHTIEQVLELPDVRERTDLYFEQASLFKKQVRSCARLDGDVVILDLRNEDPIYAGNRFMIYAMYPAARVSIHVLRGFQGMNTVFACGKSIFDRSSPVNVGELMLEFGGGGHEAAGTCQVDNDKAEEVLALLISRLRTDD